MTRYQVDSDAVMTTTTAVRASIATISSEVGALNARLIELQSSWTGSASTAFQSVVIDWKATQQQVEASLESITEALALAGQHYADAEATNARLFLR
ncbi:WXG100 family type VII secretion target [Marisediminicola sp. LYQ134]|uniref:WXG100 family type VII secretion target n=1 Tax=Marisediminicola sp. LYQ134 TaxID=3391061 RepID=UPI003983AEF5